MFHHDIIIAYLFFIELILQYKTHATSLTWMYQRSQIWCLDRRPSEHLLEFNGRKLIFKDRMMVSVQNWPEDNLTLSKTWSTWIDPSRERNAITGSIKLTRCQQNNVSSFPRGLFTPSSPLKAYFPPAVIMMHCVIRAAWIHFGLRHRSLTRPV